MGGNNKGKHYHGDLCPENFLTKTRGLPTNELQGDVAAVSRDDVEKGESVVIQFLPREIERNVVHSSRWERCRAEVEA